MEKTDNELIAEFMGIPKLLDTQGFVWDVNKTGKTIYSLKSKYLRYHESWDWLMPVVEKIQSLEITSAPNYTGYRIEIVPQGYVKISGFPMSMIITNVSIEGSLINAVYKACIEFIKYYNKSKEK